MNIIAVGSHAARRLTITDITGAAAFPIAFIIDDALAKYCSSISSINTTCRKAERSDTNTPMIKLINATYA